MKLQLDAQAFLGFETADGGNSGDSRNVDLGLLDIIRGKTPGISTTVHCIMILTIQYFLIYTAAAVLRTFDHFRSRHEKDDLLTRWLKTANFVAQTVTCAPMLCVLFIAARMRALQLSQGEREPQTWVQVLMQVCTWSLVLQSLIVLFLPHVIGEDVEGVDDHGHLQPTQLQKFVPEENESLKTRAHAIIWIRYIAMIGMYGGFAGVCVGVVTMQAPSKFYANGTPPISPAVSATVNLSIQYFCVYFIVALIRTRDWISGVLTSRAQEVMALAQYSVQFCPTLCVIFIAARMRALEMDRLHGHPQRWAQVCFYICAYAVLIKTVAVIFAPHWNIKMMKGETPGAVKFNAPHEGPLARVLHVGFCILRYGCLVAVYTGLFAVLISVFTIDMPGHKSRTPRLSTAMWCVLVLTFQSFVVYLCTWVVHAVMEFNLIESSLSEKILVILENARWTVVLCPMLSILFLAARMRALQITNYEGNPQPWAQHAMYVCTISVFLQLLTTVISPSLSGKFVKADQDGSAMDSAPALMKAEEDKPAVEELEEDKLIRKLLLAAFTYLRYAGLLALYLATLCICLSLFNLTEDTADYSPKQYYSLLQPNRVLQVLIQGGS